MPRQFLHCEIGKSYNLRVQTNFRMGLEFWDFIDGCKAMVVYVRMSHVDPLQQDHPHFLFQNWYIQEFLVVLNNP